MSGRYVSAVFESDLPPDLKFTAAVLASFADEDGYQIRPSMPRVAYLRGLQERQVQYHVRELHEMEILEVFRAATQWLPTHYRMHLGKLPARAPFVPSDRQRSMLDSLGESPGRSEAGVQPSAPLPGVQPNVSGVHWNVSGVHPSAPDPSVDPSVRSVSTHTYAGRASEAPTTADDATGESALPLIVAPSRDPDHAAHAWCGRICVPKFLHKQLKQALGGQVTKRAARMRAFYAETLDAIPALQPIGQVDPVKFWRAKFAARFETRVPRGHTNASTVDTIWTQVLARIETKVDRHTFYTWFRPLLMVSDHPTSTGRVIEVTKNGPDGQLFVDWVTKHYAAVVQAAVDEVRPGSRVVLIDAWAMDREAAERDRKSS